MLETADVITLTAWALAFGAGWLLLSRARMRDDRRPPIVGVQRRGRVYFMRRDALGPDGQDEGWRGAPARTPRRQGLFASLQERSLDAAIVTIFALLLIGALQLSL